MKKNIVTALLVGSSIFASCVYATGIPTVDVLAITQLALQLKQLEQAYEAIAGKRDLGLHGSSVDHDYLPSGWQNSYDDLIDNGRIDANASRIYAQSRIGNPCSELQDANQQAICNARAMKPSQDMAFAQETFANARRRMTNIDNMRSKIASTEDPREIANLQANISAEAAAIQNEAIELQMFVMAAQAGDAMQKERERELFVKQMSAKGGGEIKLLGNINDI